MPQDGVGVCAGSPTESGGFAAEGSDKVGVKADFPTKAQPEVEGVRHGHVIKAICRVGDATHQVAVTWQTGLPHRPCADPATKTRLRAFRGSPNGTEDGDTTTPARHFVSGT